MEKKGETKKSILPIKETKYSQSVEDMNQLIPFLIEQMKPCPSGDILFILLETVDYYALVRNFKIKSKTAKKDAGSLNKFKDNLLTNISPLETFTAVPTINSFEVETKSSKGTKFISPKIYDINGEEVKLVGREIYLFVYDNLADLQTFINQNKNSNIAISCLSINMNYFETKKWIKNNGLLNDKLFSFLFTEISPKALNTSINIKISNLPRIAIIGSDGIIHEDKYIKNVNNFDLTKDLIKNKNQKVNNAEEQGKVDKFIYLENENKRNVVKSMNIYLKKIGMNSIQFYVNSKICIDKKGIQKTRCYPVFYGEAKKEIKNLVDNLINILNGQQLFHEIQCRVKYN